MVAHADLMKSGFGPRRFYFVGADGRIPFLEVSEEIATRLEKGTAAIVEMCQVTHQDFYLVSADIAARVKKADPDVIRFWNQEK